MTNDTKIGKGRSYEILEILNTDLSELPEHAVIAIDYAKDAIESAAIGKKDLNRFEQLNGSFDMDSIVEFSNAWSRWDNIFDSLKPPIVPLDQQLFEVKDEGDSEQYFDGIADLAKKNREAVTAWIHEQEASQYEHLLDVGAGRDFTYAESFVNTIAEKVTCMDMPTVVSLAKKTTGANIEWIPHNIDKPFPKSCTKEFDMVWISNVFHHYSIKACEKILFNIQPALQRNAEIFVQEYVIDAEPKPQKLAASMLGVHFAITTNGGRCYTKDELNEMLSTITFKEDCSTAFLYSTVTKFVRGRNGK